MLTKKIRTAHRDQPAVLVAREAILLWPRDFDGTAGTVENPELWPVFAIVVDDRPVAGSATASPLLELLNRSRRGDEVVVVGAQCRWSVLNHRSALLRLSFQGGAPVRFTEQIIFPARNVLGILDLVARATIGITTSSRADQLSGWRVDIRQALSEVVLLSCPESSDLSSLKEALVSAGPGLAASGAR